MRVCEDSVVLQNVFPGHRLGIQVGHADNARHHPSFCFAFNSSCRPVHWLVSVVVPITLEVLGEGLRNVSQLGCGEVDSTPFFAFDPYHFSD
ncbi:hypothetical protein SAMN04487951_12523 [Vreelandella arcis]|uniref:Uncharacterized protein n=1 Tax=Vreelandella arcis TaxID=416873 RepID=A0A1H0JBJ3_9GAMM|nr:hypothetical protein SAMN04487951_12523 [Halomonas arcis]